MFEPGQYAKARALFKAFHNREPSAKYIKTIGMPRGPDVVLVIGELVGLVYRAIGEGTQYDHTFAKKNRPVLTVSADGKQIYILRGTYKFGPRGFIG